MNLPRIGRRSPVALAAGAVGSLALALSMNGTLSAFTAQITNSQNTAAAGYLAMKETLLDAAGNATSTSCASNDGTSGSAGTNAATCATINKYGGTTVPLTPGGAAATTKIALQNTGTVAATAFALTPGACSATVAPGAVGGGASAPCSKFIVTIKAGASNATVYSGPASAMPATIDLLAKMGTTAVAAGATVPVTISVALDPSADNTYAGYQIAQTLAWTFTA